MPRRAARLRDAGPALWLGGAVLFALHVVATALLLRLAPPGGVALPAPAPPVAAGAAAALLATLSLHGRPLAARLLGAGALLGVHGALATTSAALYWASTGTPFGIAWTQVVWEWPALLAFQLGTAQLVGHLAWRRSRNARPGPAAGDRRAPRRPAPGPRIPPPRPRESGEARGPAAGRPPEPGTPSPKPRLEPGRVRSAGGQGEPAAVPDRATPPAPATAIPLAGPPAEPPTPREAAVPERAGDPAPLGVATPRSEPEPAWPSITVPERPGGPGHRPPVADVRAALPRPPVEPVRSPEPAPEPVADAAPLRSTGGPPTASSGPGPATAPAPVAERPGRGDADSAAPRDGSPPACPPPPVSPVTAPAMPMASAPARRPERGWDGPGLDAAEGTTAPDHAGSADTAEGTGAPDGEARAPAATGPGAAAIPTGPAASGGADPGAALAPDRLVARFAPFAALLSPGGPLATTVRQRPAGRLVGVFPHGLEPEAWLQRAARLLAGLLLEGPRPEQLTLGGDRGVLVATHLGEGAWLVTGSARHGARALLELVSRRAAAGDREGGPAHSPEAAGRVLTPPGADPAAPATVADAGTADARPPGPLHDPGPGALARLADALRHAALAGTGEPPGAPRTVAARLPGRVLVLRWPSAAAPPLVVEAPLTPRPGRAWLALERAVDRAAGAAAR